MQKTIISISKGERGPIAMVKYPNRVESEIVPSLIDLWTRVVMASWVNKAETQPDEENINDTNALITLSLVAGRWVLADQSQEQSLAGLEQDDVAYLLRTAMELLVKQETVSLVELRSKLDRKKNWDNISYSKLPI